MARKPAHERIATRGVAAVAALTGCLHSPLPRAESILAAENAVAPEAFHATMVRDVDGHPFPLPPAHGDRSAVRSFRVPEEHPMYSYLGRRSFLYDDALVLLGSLAATHYSEARAIGETIRALVTSRGDVGFSVELGVEPFYDRDYVRAGVVAWAAYALARYDLETGENRFRATAARMADALLAARVTDPRDPRHGFVLAGQGRWLDHYRRFDRNFHADYCVAEHQIDLYFLLRTLATLDARSNYAAEAQTLAGRMVETLWQPEGRFATAVTSQGVTGSPALDAAGAWAALMLLDAGDTARATQAMAYVRTHFRVHVEGIEGFAPYAGPSPDHPGVDFSNMLYCEGTAAVAIAMLRMGQRADAERIAGDLSSLQSMREGGLLYAYPSEEDFPDLAAAASTAWLLFLQLELAGQAPMVFAPLRAPAGATATSHPAQRG